MKKKLIVISILVLLVAGLFSFLKANFVTYSVVNKEERHFTPPPPKHLTLVQDKNRKLIKTGELSFECKSLDKTRELVEQAVNKFDGFIARENLTSHEKRSSQSLTIRIPANHFDALVAEISTGAERIEDRTIRIEDVTDEYLDTETRLAVKRELEARYRELLPDAKTVKDILAIEEQIATLREDIESAEGQLRRFDDRVTLSTLKVTYFELLDSPPVRFSRHMRNGVGNGWDNLIWFFVGLINIWPFIVILAAILLGVKYTRKNRG